jgi:hypothetical protein
MAHVVIEAAELLVYGRLAYRWIGDDGIGS